MRLVAAALLAALTPIVGWAEDTPWAEKTHALGVFDSPPAGLQSGDQLDRLLDLGEALFAAPFTTLDGAGRPRATQAILPTKTKRPLRSAFARTSGPDANSCASCHNQPVLGGAGDFTMNVFVSEGFNNHDFDTTDPEFSNERGTNHLFGAGLIELLAREISFDLIELRRDALSQARASNAPIVTTLTSKGISFGTLTAHPSGIVDLGDISGVDADLVVRPFTQKGVVESLRQFSINAMNHHHGMQASERFGARWTGEADFDEDGINDELSGGDISALVAWQATLPAPRIWAPDSPQWQSAAAKGQTNFTAFGCATCHKMALPLNSMIFTDPSPFDGAGTLRASETADPMQIDLAQLPWAQNLVRNAQGQVMVPLFGDLKRHKMTDAEVATLGNELFSQRFVGRDTFMTAELWGVGSTAPYGHRNDLTTLDEIIRAHGGDARASRDAYIAASKSNQQEIIAYLKTLRISEVD
ncbi:hypothetical protein GCM10007939_17630 [Amylibacter marinus]|uniref:Cytochrome c domain-containing protein n=1 Tax=Amylibacter marinus TaxID=1475483 RepID=A0ABQ5VVM1_9RHOB|nr:di-heme oxidoredictase family protein [Amylibacter marinus]GLQ35480.1 hypothetical protein GCM10007939_17630 [Amylibacter marinus]